MWREHRRFVVNVMKQLGMAGRQGASLMESRVMDRVLDFIQVCKLKGKTCQYFATCTSVKKFASFFNRPTRFYVHKITRNWTKLQRLVVRMVLIWCPACVTVSAT